MKIKFLLFALLSYSSIYSQSTWKIDSVWRVSPLENCIGNIPELVDKVEITIDSVHLYFAENKFLSFRYIKIVSKSHGDFGAEVDMLGYQYHLYQWFDANTKCTHFTVRTGAIDKPYLKLFVQTNPTKTSKSKQYGHKKDSSKNEYQLFFNRRKPLIIKSI